MGIQTVTIKTCDRCGERIHPLSRDNLEAGELHLKWHGDQSAIGWDGAAGGANLKGEGLLCRICLRKFFDWMKSGADGVSASSINTKPPSDADGQPLEPSEAKDAAFPNRCGYCAQDMVPGSDCTSSGLANKCAMYQEFGATRQIEPAAMERTTQKDEGAAS